MIAVYFTPSFLRQLKSLPQDIQEEAIEKVELFKDRRNHRSLKVHDLAGRLKGRQSFSVNYRIRIVFRTLSASEVVLMAIGDHDVYRN